MKHQPKDCSSYTANLAWLQSSTRRPWRLQYFKSVFLEMSIVTLWLVFPNPVTYTGVYIPVYSCIYWCILAYNSVYWCIPVYTDVYLCILVYTCVYWCIPVCTCVCWCILVYTGVYLCIIV